MTGSFVIGVDPGASGGIVVVNGDEVFGIHKMPEDPQAIVEIFRPFVQYSTILAIEQVPKFAGAARWAQRNIMGSAMATLYGNYQLCAGIGYGMGIPVFHIHPIKWQNLVQCRNSEKLDKGPWKNKLKARAQELWPGHKITLATADAFLIAKAAQSIRQ